MELKFTDDFRAQQRDDVRADGELEAGEDFLGYRRSAEHVPAFEYQDLFACARQVRGVHKAIVPTPDHDSIVSRTHDSSGSVRCATLAYPNRALSGGV